MKNGIELIAEERQRQVEKEGWTPEHDDQHENGEMALAACCYAHPAPEFCERGFFHPKSEFKIPQWWPWDEMWWKPTPDDKIRQLTKAGALIAAEIDRLQRLEK